MKARYMAAGLMATLTPRVPRAGMGLALLRSNGNGGINDSTRACRTIGAFKVGSR